MTAPASDPVIPDIPGTGDLLDALFDAAFRGDTSGLDEHLRDHPSPDEPAAVICAVHLASVARYDLERAGVTGMPGPGPDAARHTPGQDPAAAENTAAEQFVTRYVATYCNDDFDSLDKMWADLFEQGLDAVRDALIALTLYANGWIDTGHLLTPDEARERLARAET